MSNIELALWIVLLVGSVKAIFLSLPKTLEEFSARGFSTKKYALMFWIAVFFFYASTYNLLRVFRV